MNNQNSHNRASIVKTRSLSPIWFLPFVAALLGLWVLFENITHANVEVKIHFENAEGIIVNKTKIRYKGVIVGSVKKIELDSSSGVNIIAEIESHATFMLRQKTKFWLVSPKASLTSISGLDTLFSGSYINMLPVNGNDNDKVTVFNATSEQPITIPDNALLVNLHSATAASISEGTPLFFKKIKVGEVVRIRLDNSGHFVNIKAFIEKSYSHLIKEESIFWNISGLSANLSRTGFDFKLDSLTSLIAGGITFSSPENSQTVARDSEFVLFESIDKTETGLTIELILNNITNLPKGAGILFKGHGIGRITAINYSAEKKQFIAKAVINPQFSSMITKNAQFWIEKTAISFSKIANLGNLITGDYIAFSPDLNQNKKNREVATKFVVQHKKVSLSSVLPLLLLTEDATGLNDGDPVSYQGIKIGAIEQLSFSSNGAFVETIIHIDNQYRYLINKNSQFYLLSGINFKASLKGVEVQSTPFENFVSGGIGLYNKYPVKNNAKKNTETASSKKLQRFRLYPSKAMAKLGKNVFSKALTVSVLSKLLPSVNEGSPVYYHKLPIGEVSSFSIDNSGLMSTKLIIKGQYKHLVKENTIFWNISGFKIDAGLSGIKVQADSLLAIASGGIALDIGNKSINNRYSNGAYKLFSSQQAATQPELPISIEFEQAYDLQVGSLLKLKGLVIGEVKELKLTANGKVKAIAHLYPQFGKQVARKGTRFWIIRSELSFSGAKNLDTLISGVYLNVIPGEGKKRSHFKGEANAPTIALKEIGLAIVLLADNAGSTDINSPVYFRQIKIGEVISKQLSKDASGVEITLNIYPQYAHLIRKNSTFWPASGFNLNIGITGAVLKSTSLISLIKGGISMSTTDQYPLQAKSKAFARFKLKTEMNKKWLKWKLVIPKP